MAMSQALQLVADLKLGWYTSIPPREMFAAQIIGTVLGALTNCESSSQRHRVVESLTSAKTSLCNLCCRPNDSIWTVR